MKQATIILVLLMCGLVGLVSADEAIGVFANSNTNCIQFIDPVGLKLSPSLLKGDIGTYGGGLFDVVITANGKTAVVSNFGDSRIYFIDISGGFDAVPTLIGEGYVSFFAEDMAIIPNSNYVLVTDGGGSSVVAVMDIKNGTLVRRVYLKGRGAQAVAVTPDGQLALFADYARRAVHSYSIGSNGSLTFKETQLVSPVNPVNIAISPDGKTVIVPCAGYSITPIFQIDSLHNLCFKGFIPLPAKNGQSCVFYRKNNETKAYYLSNSQTKGTLVIELNVTGPGKVSATGTSIVVSPMRGTSQLFGVDTMAIDPDGNFLYVTNPALSPGIAAVSVIDLTQKIQVDLWPTTGIPTGIAFATIKKQGNGQ